MSFTNAFRWKDSQTCQAIRERLSAYADGALPHADRRQVAVHLRDCGTCQRHHEELVAARRLMKALPVAAPPPVVQARLREMAARESLKRRHGTERIAAQFAIEGIKLRLTNLMRPLAIPFAGGLVSAMVLFSMLVPTYPVAARTTPNDVPTGLYQEPTVKSMAPFALTDDEVVVEITVDETGQVIDYTLPNKVSNELRREIENQLLFARFTPAMAFGTPMTGRIRLSFRRSHIDVKG